MNTKKFLVILAIFALILAACAPAATPTPTEEPSIPAEEPTEEPAPEEPAEPAPEETEEPAEEPAGGPIKFGFFGPLTGPTSFAGQALLQGAQLRVKEINEAGGVLGEQIELITCDDKSTPEEAVKCVQKLINSDHVIANVGSLHSPHLMATGPILDEFKVPTVAAGTSPTWCEEGFEYLWRSLANSARSSDALAAALADSDLSTMAMLYQNDDFGISGKDAIKASLSSIEVTTEEAYNLGDTDWSGQMIKMIATEPDLMVVFGLGDHLGPQLNQLRDLGWSGLVVSSDGGCTYPPMLDVAGENANGTVCAAMYYVPEAPEDMVDPAIREFLENYVAEFGEVPASDNAYRGYDSVSVLVRGIEDAGELDPEKIKDGINSISDLVGLAGTFNYAEGGCEGIIDSRVWEIEDGSVIPFNGLDGGMGTAPAEGDTVKFGFFGPLTGPTSFAGQALLQGAQLRVKEINEAGGVLGEQIELITCDDKSTPEEAVKCVQKLINSDHVIANVGSLHSPHLMATGPILDEFKVPTVAAGTSPTWCEEGFEYLWRSLANSARSSDALAAALADSDLSTMAMLYQNDDFGISGKDAIKASLSSIEVTTEEAYNLGDTDWSGQMIKMIATEPDLMVVFGLGDHLGPQLNQLRNLGWDGLVVSSDGGCTYPPMLDVAGENANGTVCAAMYYVPEAPEDMADPAIREFLENYVAEFGEVPASDNAYRGYDSVSVLVRGIEDAGELDPEKIKDGINSISDLVGLAGTFNYAEGGCEGIIDSRVWEIENESVIPFNGIE